VVTIVCVQGEFVNVSARIGLDKVANDIREDDKKVFDVVVLVAEENQRVFKASNKEKLESWNL
jgi:hypothetical protein